MVKAMETLKLGRVGVNQATLEYKVHTLEDRLSGKVRHGEKLGSEPYLTSEEDSESHS